MVTARVSGKRVEDLSQRTETSTTWANPDGTFTTSSHMGQIRFRDEAGRWRDVDLDLARGADGSVAPKGHALGLRLAGRTGAAGTTEMIAISEHGGRTVSLGWQGSLPAPELDGSRATYIDVQPGVDVVVEALRNGFEQFFVLNERPTEAVSWKLPLRTKGLTVRAEKDGAISFIDSKGAVRSRIPAAVAWDARVDERTGEHTKVAPVSMSVEQRNPGLATLTVTPDPKWLADPATVFPVTVDPTYASATRNTTFDTFVQQGYSTGQSASTELKLGNNGSGQIARSFLEFKLGTLKDKKIITAKLWLRATHSWSCNTRYWEAWKVGGDVGTSTVWSNQPGWDAQYSSGNQTKGYSSACPDGNVSIGMKDLVQYWADNNLDVNRVGLRAANESDPYGWKKFASSETANDPYIEVNYNRVPGTASTPTLSPVTTYNSVLYTYDTTPKLTSKASDADGNSVTLKFEVHTSKTTSSSTLKASCTTDSVSQGTSVSCSPGTALADNATYYVRSKANDGFKDGAWSAWTTFKMAAAQPARPVISCPGYADGSWTEALPTQNVACTITATGSGTNAPGYIKYAIDGATTKRVQITQSTDPTVAKVDISVSASAGGHKVQAWSESPSSKVSTEATYAFGYGKLGISSPAAHPMLVTTGAVDIVASGPPASGSTLPTAQLKWRVASSGGDQDNGWNVAKTLDVAADPTAGGLAITGRWDTMSVSHDAAAGLDLDSRVPVLLELQVCVEYAAGTQCTWFEQARRVLRVPHAFGEGFPVADAGPGQVALWTGEFNTQITDIAVPGYTGSLSIARSYSTYAGAPTKAAAVFGPGWTAQLDGPEAGVAGYEVVDNTRLDGTIAVISPEGSAMILGPKGGLQRRTGAELAQGDYVGVDDDTIHLGVTAKVSGTGSATTFEFTDPGGVTTTFKAITAPSTTGAAVFAPASVDEPRAAGDTTYDHDTDGRVTRILAAVPPGMTASDCPETGTLEAGCRSLRIEYATTTTTTPTTTGDVAGQVKAIHLDIYDPDKPGGAGMRSIAVAQYTYDQSKRLHSVTDPRTGLATSYTYDSQGRLTEIAPPGLAAFVVEYDETGGKLTRVTRELPDGSGSAALATIVYGVPTAGTTGLPDLSATAVMDGWGQETAPTFAAAVFGPEKPVTTTDPAQVAPGDWAYATLSYTDELGYAVNTAEYGAGDWQISHTGYDDHGHVVRQLDVGDIARIKAGDITVADAGTLTTYNSPGNGPASAPSGAVVTDTYGPARWVTVSDGTVVLVRPHSHTDFDEGSPNEGVNPTTQTGWGLPTTVTVEAVDPQSLAPVDGPVSVTKSEYGNLDGWKLGVPTKNIHVMAGGQPDIVRSNAYDAEGRVTETRQPRSDGSDAGSRRTVYYTVAPNAEHSDCGEKPQWAGLVCLTYFGGPAGGGKELPVTETVSYNYLLAPALVEESLPGDVTPKRTTTAEYDQAGRVTKRWTRTDGVAQSSRAPGASFEYDPLTGLQIRRVATDHTGAPAGDPEVTRYDSWGQITQYAPTPGEVTTTTYDSSGRVLSVAEPQGTKTYGYDGTDASGAVERRGLPTKLTVTNAAGREVQVDGAFDADGNLVVQKVTGGITQRWQYDEAGEPIGLTYSGQVTSVADDGSTTVDADGVWLGWSVENDVLGRVISEWTPEGSAFTSGGLETGSAAGYSRKFGYDRAGRLTTVEDHVGSPGAGFDDTTGALVNTACETRTYIFDASGNRTSLTRTGAQADGSCATSGGVETTWNYDASDRLAGAYQYDDLGRTLAVPAVDTPAGSGAGDVQLTYFDNDAVASITQGGTETVYAIDPGGRATSSTSGPEGGTPTETVVRHYTNGSDVPTWISSTVGVTSSVTRYVNGLNSDLIARVTDTGAVTLPVVNMHGDSVTSIEVPGTGPAVGIGTWTTYDELGNPLDGAPTGSSESVSYGWLGGKQRATQDAGLILMGARVYNPVTSAFTSPDPIFGGNLTAYAYPADPVNSFDLSGLCSTRCTDRYGFYYITATWYSYGPWLRIYDEGSRLGRMFGWVTGFSQMEVQRLYWQVRTRVRAWKRCVNGWWRYGQWADLRYYRFKAYIDPPLWFDNFWYYTSWQKLF